MSDSERVIREDLEQLMYEMYKKNFKLFPASGSSTGASLGPHYNSLTLKGSAVGVGVNPSMSTTGTVVSSGTAGSAMSSTPPPEWVYIPWSTSYNYKHHLQDVEDNVIESLCGIEAQWRESQGRPPIHRMCKRCQKIFTKRVLEGRYER